MFCRKLLRFAPRTCWEISRASRSSEFLSGLLIGAEVASMREFVRCEQAVTIVAGAALTRRATSRRFARLAVCEVSTVSGDTAFQAGIRSIAHAVAKLVFPLSQWRHYP